MIDERFVFLGAMLSMTGSARYAWSTVRGATRPNRVTWFLWAAAPLIGFAAQLDAGVGLPAVLTLSIGLGPALIFASTFVNPAAYWRISRFDLGCGAVSVAAIVIWRLTGDPALAVIFAVLADLVAGLPTVRKGWAHPETENGAVFVFGALNGVVTLLTIDTWSAATWAFPVYITLLGSTLFAVISVRGRRPVASSP